MTALETFDFGDESACMYGSKIDDSEIADLVERCVHPPLVTPSKSTGLSTPPTTPPPEKSVNTLPKDDEGSQVSTAKRKIDFDAVEAAIRVFEDLEDLKGMEEERDKLARKCLELEKDVATLKDDLRKEVEYSGTLEKGMQDAQSALSSAYPGLFGDLQA